MISSNVPMIRKNGIFLKVIVKLRALFWKKQYENTIDKAEFFNIYEDMKNGDISMEEIDTEVIERLVKIAYEERKIKSERLKLLKQELIETRKRVLEV